MRIALVTETFPPEVNGVAMTLNRLVRGLAKRGHRVQVVRPRQSRRDGPSNDGGIEQVTVPGVPLPRYEGLHMGLPAWRRLRRRWRDDPPDLVHVATEGPLGLSAIWAARGRGLPLVSSFHTNFHQYGAHYGYGPFYRIAVAYLRYVHNRTSCTMTPTQDVIDELSKLGLRNLAVMARGVDTALFDPARRSEELRRQWGAGPDDLVVAYVGRIAGEKNIPLAVEAFEGIKAVQPGAKFVLVGDGPLRGELERKHPDYVFCGMQRGEDLARHYASADAFLFASETETFGNVVTEAMASGLAVLTYDYAAGRMHIRDGENGLLAPLGDDEAFVEAARTLAWSTQRVRALGHAARETTRAITWDAVIDQYLRTVEAACEGVPAAEPTARPQADTTG